MASNTNSDALKPIVVRLDRELYYDNEEVRGDVTFRGISSVTRTYKSVMIILWARYVQYNNGEQTQAFSLHMLKMPIAQELILKSGDESIVPFQFIIPPNSPPSFLHRSGAVQWRVAVVHEISSGKAIRAVAAKAFRKASLYHSLPAFLPKAQSEARMAVSKNKIRAEAVLSKDVYSTDEAVSVSVTVHEENTDRLPAVTSIKAKIVQHTRASKGTFSSSTQYKLCKISESISTWDATHLADNKGTVVEKTLVLKPELVDSKLRPRCGHQMVVRPSPEKNTRAVNVLAPTCRFTGHEGQEAHLTYAVQIEVRVPSGNDLSLSLPFVMQNEPNEAVRATSEEQSEVMHNLPVFCNVDDDLPAYEDVDKLSLPTYTSLRRNSIDSVFAAALSLDAQATAPGLNTPPLGNCRGTQGRRHSSAVHSSLLAPQKAGDDGEDTPGTRSRRGSLTVFAIGQLLASVHSNNANTNTRLKDEMPHVDTAPGSPVIGHDNTSRPRRRSAASILLENPVSATANRTLRRLRANTHSPVVMSAHHTERRGSLRPPAAEEDAADPQQVFLSFKARYIDAPVVVTMDNCQGSE